LIYQTNGSQMTTGGAQSIGFKVWESY